MSGPKTSRYTLTIEQRRMLAVQRDIELRKAVATENIKRNQKRLLQISEKLGSEKPIARELNSAVGSVNSISALFKELDSRIAQIDILIRDTNFDDVNSVERTSDTISTYCEEAEKIESRIRTVFSANEHIRRATLRQTTDAEIATSFAEIKEIKVSKIDSLRNKTTQRLEQIRKIDFLPHAYKSEINGAIAKLGEITDDIFLKNFVAVSVNPLIKQANRYITEYLECKAEFDRLYAEYTTLCKLYYYVVQEYECSRTSIQILKAEIERIKKSVAEDDEQSYISDCIDEVMVEMGYSVLGYREVTKRNGRRFRNELYAYGDGMAVNVTYSSDGKIAMELGGTDTSDRVPTGPETDMLCGAMEQFCDDFNEIENKLMAKGVVLADRISLLPPDAECAQIINTSDYCMETKTASIRVKKKRKHITEQKTLKRKK